MSKTSPAHATPLRDELETLAALEPQAYPCLSLYLDLGPNQQGRENYDVFTRKVFAERSKAFPLNSPERESFDRDVERIQTYLDDAVNRSASSLAIFACAGGELFDAIPLQVPLGDHWLFIGPTPHLYPLARAADQYPRYAAVITDTNRARIFVFSLGEVEQTRELTGTKTRRTSMGGWSQARYQRRTENVHLHHVKEVVDTLNRIVTAENIRHIVIAGDLVVVPLVKEQLPQNLIDRLVDSVQLDAKMAEEEFLERTLATLQQKDAESDAELVQEAVGAWQASGLGTVGPEGTLEALMMGQVDQLLITGTPQQLRPVQTLPPDTPAGELTGDTSLATGPGDPEQLKLASELITRAEQTGARVRFIENEALLKDFGGVAALLRFRL